MPIVIEDVYGPKPSMTMLGGSPSSLAAPSVPFLPHSGSVALTRDGLRTVSFAAIYRSQPWIGGPVRRMAEAIARLPLGLYRYLDVAGDTRERDRAHGAAQLLKRPRPRQRTFHLVWDIALSLYVQGEWVGWKKRPSRGAPPTELWTLDWRCLVPVMAGGRVLAWRWYGDGVPGLERGDLILIEDTVHIGFGSPGGGELGVSPLEQLATTIRSEESLQRLAEANARNGTRFGVGVILDPKVKADAVLRNGIRDEIEEAHGGVDQAYRSAILGGGITDIKPLGQQTAVEAELINQRKVNREEAAAVIGLPQPLAGILDESNYSSLRELHRLFYTTSLGGPLELVIQSLMAQLLDAEPAWADDDRFLEFNLDVVLKGDTKERWETYAVALDHGGLTLNDVRKRENLKPYDDPRADEPLIAANNVRPLSAVGTGGDVTIEQRVTQAIAKAMRDLEAGELDADAAEAELVGALEALGLNGQSSAIAEQAIELALAAHLATQEDH